MNVTIRTKLFGGFAIVLILLVFLAVFIVNKYSESNRRLLSIVDVSSQKVNLSNEIMISVLDAGRQEKNIILEKNPVKKDNYKTRLYSAVTVVDRKTAVLREMTDSQGRVILNEFSAIWTDYKADLDEIVLLSMQNNDESAAAISVSKGKNVRDAAIVILERLIARNMESMQRDKTDNIAAYDAAVNLTIALIFFAVVLAVILSYWIISSITRRIAFISKEAEKIASRELAGDKWEDKAKDELSPVFKSLVNISDSFKDVTDNADKVAAGDYQTDFTPLSDRDQLGHALKKMTRSLRETTEANNRHIWMTQGQNRLNEKLIGNQDVDELANNIISFLCAYLEADIGAIYLAGADNGTLTLAGTYAFPAASSVKTEFAPGEGLVGQAALEQKIIFLSDFSDEQLRISSSLLNAKPRQLLIAPIVSGSKTLGVIEMGCLDSFGEVEIQFINAVIESIGININAAIARKQVQELLEETQVQGEELQVQQEELKQMNEELEEQTQALKQQQEELQTTNEELEEQTQALELKNREVENARYDIEQKSLQLELNSKYKSEFLANMSHELRTPLNSLLILSKDLADNGSKNLTEDQVESAEIIYKSGNDLLSLINEVLDLSKVEAGKMSVNIEKISLRQCVEELLRDFKRQAEQKGIALTSVLDAGLPEFIYTDPQRLKQILKNLLSNAVKFTDKGSITVKMKPYEGNRVMISVTDTGIGIPADKQATVFEAFQQADGGTSRKYGGTGLGLSISREMAKLLGGEITLSSKPGEGAVFSLIIPLEIRGTPAHGAKPAIKKELALFSVKDGQYLNYPSIEDDRQVITTGDKIVLIIEDDLQFAGILSKLVTRKGYKYLAATTGEDGLQLAAKYRPDAVILDLDLPGINGETVLLELKENPELRHIPVHIISVNERSIEPIKNGAVDYLMKPVDKEELEEVFNRIENFINKKMRNLLIVEDDESSIKAMRKLIGNGDVNCFEAQTGKDAIAKYRENHIDCIVLDLGLPDMSGFELVRELENITGRKMPPIIVYTGRELSREENNELQKYAESIIIKGVKSEERLLDETALFLHRTIGDLPESKQAIITNLYNRETVFQSKKILLADDDMRNIFALSKKLKERGMEVFIAENGRIALEMLDRHGDTDMVLMDIMMPEMDGYEAMRRIRAQERFKALPVIALTAKAMKDDKQKCIDAGASDYITKPIDVERLLSLMRVWLSK